MGEWIPLDSSKLNTPQRMEVKGVSLDVLMSPFDIPTDVRTSKINDGDLLIEFRYMDEEPKHRQIKDEGITLIIGKHSERVFGLEIDKSKFETNGQTVTLRLIIPEASSAIDHLNKKLGKRAFKRNYEVAKKALSNMASQEFMQTA